MDSLLSYSLTLVAIYLMLCSYLIGYVNWKQGYYMIKREKREDGGFYIFVGWGSSVLAYNLALTAGLGYEPYWAAACILALLFDLPGILSTLCFLAKLPFYLLRHICRR